MPEAREAPIGDVRGNRGATEGPCIGVALDTTYETTRTIARIAQEWVKGSEDACGLNR